MDPNAFRDNLIESLRIVGNMYVKDLKALSDEQFFASPGGARRAADYTYEVVFVNRFFAGQLGGQPVKFPDLDGWMTAPEDYTKDAAIEGLGASIEELVEAFKALPLPWVEITTERGPREAWGLVQFAMMHTNYHDGQINLLQEISGDMEMHWGD